MFGALLSFTAAEVVVSTVRESESPDGISAEPSWPESKATTKFHWSNQTQTRPSMAKLFKSPESINSQNLFLGQRSKCQAKSQH